MAKRMEQFILNEVEGAYSIDRNKRVSKEECVRSYEKACFDIFMHCYCALIRLQ